jgi:hypothetical protein
VVPNICGPSLWNSLYVTLLVPIIRFLENLFTPNIFPHRRKNRKAKGFPEREHYQYVLFPNIPVCTPSSTSKE